jgi:hypothetical protein
LALHFFEGVFSHFSAKPLKVGLKHKWHKNAQDQDQNNYFFLFMDPILTIFDFGGFKAQAAYIS